MTDNFTIEDRNAISPSEPVAVVCVGERGEWGFHLLSALLHRLPYFCGNVVFFAVDSNRRGLLSRKRAVAERRDATLERLALHVEVARRKGLKASFRYAAGADPLDEAENLCASIAEHFPKATFYFYGLPENPGKKEDGSCRRKLRERLVLRRLATATLPLTVADFTCETEGGKA